MPRLTNVEFIRRHKLLAELWNDATLQNLFSSLKVSEQMDLHQYYQTLNTGAEAELVKTCKTINSASGSLPQRAGRAYSRLQEVYINGATTLGVRVTDDLEKSVSQVSRAYRRHQRVSGRTSQSRSYKQHHQIKTLMRPDIDLKTLAKILFALAVDIEKQQKAGQVMEDPLPETATMPEPL